MSKKHIKVIIADDSGFMRLLIRSILRMDESIQVAGEAANGQEAYELTLRHHPDVVIMDISMPEFDGVYAVEKIMSHCPTSILILSAMGHTDFDPIMRSLELGAFDYLNKPEGNLKLKVIDSEIIQKIKQAAQTGVRPVTRTAISSPKEYQRELAASPYGIVVIGASTGGPTALETVIRSLPEHLPIPVMVVQHMPPQFVHSFANRLNSLSKHRVCVASVGTCLKPGIIYLAPGDRNIKLERKKDQVHVEETQEFFQEYNKPSINSLMLSVAEVYGNQAVGVILTGMGKDGARGLSAISQKGGYTIVQDEASSVVFGMPKEALAICPVQSVLPITAVGNFIGDRVMLNG